MPAYCASIHIGNVAHNTVNILNIPSTTILVLSYKKYIKRIWNCISIHVIRNVKIWYQFSSEALCISFAITAFRINAFCYYYWSGFIGKNKVNENIKQFVAQKNSSILLSSLILCDSSSDTQYAISDKFVCVSYY